MKRAIVTAIVMAGGVAHADRLDDRWRLEGGLGMREGSFLVNNHAAGDDDDVIGGHATIGARKARWSGYAEYGLIGIDFGKSETAALAATSTDVGSGLMHRLGANARYAFGRIGGGYHASELYVESGLGIQHYRWDAGGHWTRPDFAFGVGGTSMFGGGQRHAGLSVGLRVLLSRRDDVASNAPAACGGPCNVATQPTGIDRSFMLDMTLHFGT
jgi:hypothetical protein